MNIIDDNDYEEDNTILDCVLLFFLYSEWMASTTLCIVLIKTDSRAGKRRNENPINDLIFIVPRVYLMVLERVWEKSTVQDKHLDLAAFCFVFDSMVCDFLYKFCNYGSCGKFFRSAFMFLFTGV